MDESNLLNVNLDAFESVNTVNLDRTNPFVLRREEIDRHFQLNTSPEVNTCIIVGRDSQNQPHAISRMLASYNNGLMAMEVV